MPDVDDLAQEIRRVDGSHSLGAGALAEALMPFFSAYGDARAEHARRVAMEEAAKLIESLRDDHCAATNDPDSKIAGCEPDGNMCDFVTAWNDSIQAIRAAAPPQGEQT